jgi:hypothetical protein
VHGDGGGVEGAADYFAVAARGDGVCVYVRECMWCVYVCVWCVSVYICVCEVVWCWC